MAPSSAPPSTACFDKAVRLIARRPHFRGELEGKLAQRGFAAAEIDAALERLAALGYLDDARHARELAQGVFRRRGYGPRRVRAELERRGVEAADVEAALAAAFAEGEEERVAGEVARRWLRARGGGAEALGRHLDRKGYSRATVVRLVRRLGREGATPEEPESAG